MPVKIDLLDYWVVINPKIKVPEFLKMAVDYSRSYSRSPQTKGDEDEALKRFLCLQKDWLSNSLTYELPKENLLIPIPTFFKVNPKPMLPIFLSVTEPSPFDEDCGWMPYVYEISSEKMYLEILEALECKTPLDFSKIDINFDPSLYYLFGNYIWEFVEKDNISNREQARLLLLQLLDKEKRKWKNLEQKYSSNPDSSFTRKTLPDSVRIFVWRRDEGKCVYCGCRENLEFDHIIPVSKGGSNTERNIQILCEECNRKKNDNI